MGHLFFQMISYLLALFFVMLGILCTVIPWSEPMRRVLVDFLEHGWATLFFIGVGCLVIGLAVLINLSISGSRRYYAIRTGPSTISIDKALIEAYLKEYFSGRYPKRDIPCRVMVKRNHLQIAADLPNTPLSGQRDLLKDIEKEIRELLSTNIGYDKSLRLFISFGQ